VDLDLRPRRARLGRRLRRCSLGALVALLALPLITGAAAGGSGPPGGSAGAAKHHCRRLRLPVAVAAGQPASYQVAGTLCTPGSTRGRTLQVLVPGAGVDQHYWDFPYRPERYSYVRAATSAGYATLNIDRMFVAVSIITILGIVMLGAARAFEQRMQRWKPRATE